MTSPVVTRVSQATLLCGSSEIAASRMASEIWSAILSGCPSVTDSEVKRCDVLSFWSSAAFQAVVPTVLCAILLLPLQLCHHALQDNAGHFRFWSPGDEAFPVRANHVDLVLVGAEPDVRPRDVVADYEVRPFGGELAVGVGNGVAVRCGESYHKEVRIPLPNRLEDIRRRLEFQAREALHAPDLLSYGSCWREIRDRGGHDQRVRLSCPL